MTGHVMASPAPTGPAAPPPLQKAPPAPMERLVSLVRSVSGEDRVRIAPMPGGASTRQFYRVDLAGGATAVAMYVPDAGTAEEVTSVDESARRWPFLEVRDLLDARGVRVPRLLAEDTAAGLLLVEDLGDQTIADYIAKHPERTEVVYRTAVADLARAQVALAELPEDCVVRERTFDVALLDWELHHFREWALEARGAELSAADQATFRRLARSIASEIASWPRGFVHRDYQSRNLMVLGAPGAESLAWVDFQDALLGPRVYDLVALLQDSYQTFDDAFVDRRLDEYAALRGLDDDERAAMHREFHLVSVQRKLKDAGRFVFIEHKKGDASYLRFVEPTLEKVRRSLARLANEPDLAELGELLARTSS